MSNQSNSTDRDFAAEYLQVRLTWQRSDGSMAARNMASKESAKIARAARKAGVELDEIGLDEIGLDEQARKQVFA
jgi:hypothetical protein